MKMILNTSPFPVTAQFDRAFYVFKSGERVELSNTYAANHIIDRWGKYGLVDITYNDRVAQKYLDHEFYVHEQTTLGLTKLLQTYLEKNQNFETYANECGEKKTVERLRYAQEQKKVLADIEKIEATIKKHEATDVQVMLNSKADRLRAQADKLMKEAAGLSGNNTRKSTSATQNRATGS